MLLSSAFRVSHCYNGCVGWAGSVLMAAIFSVFVSPAAVVAPCPSRVALRAASFGASWLCVRPSGRSFSGWVAVALFASGSSAHAFAQFAASRLGLPFCAVRSCGDRWSVSVPCFVSRVPFAWSGCLPFAWLPLSSCAGSSASSVGVPAAVASAVASSPVLGFSGSRSVVPPVLGVVLKLAAGGSSPVFVGCAPGCDRAVVEFFPPARVRVFSVVGASRGAFAARSSAFVSQLAAAGGVLFSFPSGPCPAGLLPSSVASRCFCGAGSGSWASLAFAVGLGVPSFVWLPAGVVVPAAWGFSSLGGGWWSFIPATQLSFI